MFTHFTALPSLPCSRPGAAMSKFWTWVEVMCPASRSGLLGPCFPPAERKQKQQSWSQKWKRPLLRMADQSSQLRIASFWTIKWERNKLLPFLSHLLEGAGVCLDSSYSAYILVHSLPFIAVPHNQNMASEISKSSSRRGHHMALERIWNGMRWRVFC